MATIPDYHDYLVNYPLFWKTDMFDSLSSGIQEIVASQRSILRTILKLLSASWPFGRLTEKNLGVAYYQVQSRTFRLYNVDEDPRVTRGTFCFLPALELINQNVTANSKIVRDHEDASIAVIATRTIDTVPQSPFISYFRIESENETFRIGALNKALYRT